MTATTIATTPLVPPMSRAERIVRADRIRRLTGRALLGVALLIALFLAYEFTIASMRADLAQRELRREFVAAVKSGNAGLPEERVDDGPVAELRIPQLGLDQIVVQGSTPERLQAGPGHYPASVLPGEFGNAVILGHGQLAGGVFRGLSSLHKGDEIEVVTGQGAYTYEVRKVRRIHKGKRDVIGPSLDSRLTLVSSAGLMSTDRLAVIAKLKGKPVGVPTRPAEPASESAGGRAGDDGRLFAAIIWLELLLVVLVGAGFAYRTWPRPVAHLVSTPVVVAVLLVLFMNLDRALPGTT